MLTVPVALQRLIVRFAPLFSKRVGTQAQVRLSGTRLTPGQRMVTAAVRVLGLSQERHYQNSHRVLNRAPGSSRAVGRVRLELLLRPFVPTGPGVMGLDDTLERRRGEKLRAKGSYRAPGRASRAHGVKARGLRWLCALVLVPIGWAGRPWALPFLTGLCPSERSHQQRGQRPKTLPAWARPMLGLVRRWLPGREVIFVADRTSAVSALLKRVSDTPGVSLSTRLRRAAALYDPAPPRLPKHNGRPRKKGARRPTLQQGLDNPQTQWTPVTVNNW